MRLVKWFAFRARMGKLENHPFSDEVNEFEDFIMKNEKSLEMLLSLTIRYRYQVMEG